MTVIKKLLIWLSLVVVVVLGSIVLSRLLFWGKLEISTSATGATITIFNEAREVEYSKVATRTVKRLKPGNYVVEISRDDDAGKKVVTIKPRQTSLAELGLAPLKKPVLVSSYPASAVNLSSDSLLFLEPRVRRVYEQSSQQAVPAPYLDLPNLVEVSWINKTSGVARTANRNAYYFSKNSLRDVSLPKEAEDLSLVDTIATDTVLGRYAYSSDNSVFIVEPPRPAKHLLSVSYPNPSMALSKGQLAVFSYPVGYPDLYLEEDVDINETPIPPGNLKIVDVETKAETSVNNSDPILAVNWSPGGGLLAYQTPSFINIFEIEKSGLTHQLAKDSPIQTPLLWLDDKRVLYADNSGIWQYTLEQGTSQRLVKFDRLQSYFSLTQSSELDYIVYSTSDPQKSGIYKFSLTKEPSSIELALSKVLPYQTEQFEIDMINISKPTVLIKTLVPRLTTSKKDYDAKNKEYRDQALKYLKGKGINLPKNSVIFLAG